MRRFHFISSGIVLAMAIASCMETPVASASEVSSSVGIVQGYDRIEEEVPVGTVTQTGDDSLLGAVVFAGTGAGLMGLAWAARCRRDDERGC